MNLKIRLRHIFIPHEHNEYRPHAIRHKWLSIYSIGIILHYFMFGVAVSGPIIKDTNAFSKDIINYTNQERMAKGFASLNENPSLDRAANDKLADMLKDDYWDHKSKDGLEVWVFIDKEGYNYSLAGENLAKGFTSASNTVSAWMGSKTHRENLLNSEFKDIGIATGNGRIGGQETTLVVQLFGKPGTSVAANNPNSLVLGEQVTKPSINLSNILSVGNIPYLSLWFIILTFIILDARMLHRLGIHNHRYHKYQFRQALVLNITLFLLLILSFTSIA